MVRLAPPSEDVYLILFKPTVSFLEKVYLVLFRPSDFAGRIDLGDQSNFVRQARFYIEAAAYSLLLTSATASITELWLIRSEVRYWCFLSALAALQVVTMYFLTRAFARRRISFADCLHVFLPIAAAVMVFCAILRVLYHGSVILLDASLGTSVGSVGAPDPFNVELWSCIFDSSAILSTAFGSSDGFVSGKSGLVTFLESGGAGHLFAITSASVIAAQKFSITRVRAGFLALSSMVVPICVLALALFGMVTLVVQRTDCINGAYLRMGHRDPVLLLSNLAEGQQELVPKMWSNGVLATKVSFDSSGLIFEFQDSNAHEGLPLVDITAIDQNVTRDVYCDLAMKHEDFYWVLRDLSLGVTWRYVLTKRNEEVVAAVQPADCRLNFSRGSIRWLSIKPDWVNAVWGDYEFQNPEIFSVPATDVESPPALADIQLRTTVNNRGH